MRLSCRLSEDIAERSSEDCRRQNGPHIVANVARATAIQVRTKYTLGTNAARNVRIKKLATAQGTIKSQMMREMTKVFMASSLPTLRALVRNRGSRMLPFVCGYRMGRLCRASSSSDRR